MWLTHCPRRDGSVKSKHPPSITTAGVLINALSSERWQCKIKTPAVYHCTAWTVVNALSSERWQCKIKTPALSDQCVNRTRYVIDAGVLDFTLHLSEDSALTPPSITPRVVNALSSERWQCKIKTPAVYHVPRAVNALSSERWQCKIKTPAVLTHCPRRDGSVQNTRRGLRAVNALSSERWQCKIKTPAVYHVPRAVNALSSERWQCFDQNTRRLSRTACG